MSTTGYDDSNLSIAEGYYHAMLEKDFDAMGKSLHPDVQFISPLVEMSGKDRVLESAKKLSDILGGIEIRAKFSSANHIMMAYDFMFPKSIGKLRAAVFMQFNNKLISRIELFFDAKPFDVPAQ